MASINTYASSRPGSLQSTPSSNRDVDIARSSNIDTASFVTIGQSELDSAAPTFFPGEAAPLSPQSDATIAPPSDEVIRRVDSLDITDTDTVAGAEEKHRWNSMRDSTKSTTTVDFPSYEEEDSFENTSAQGPRTRSNSRTSSNSEESDNQNVDWSQLEKNEEDEARDEVSDQSTAFLLARLEQENNALTADPRFNAARFVDASKRNRGQSRPPSIQMLKRLVKNPPARVSRYSLMQQPPPMTELEFWAALVKDYPQTAQRLPTLTSNKIKSGVPPPLRGVVWVSMVGARDEELADQFDKLCNASSPYETLIGKDIGRSFPGVEMFRDPEGEGQQMLGRVLRAFSLYDTEIGYCQGLGFLVGPLLMQMGDKDAFCVLVKLMENYDLRSCFLPNLAGLHVRIFQFQKLLDQHMPELAAHLASMQVEAAYLSQWFLSFFAVTCPLPMLFRIYDIIFAEGASETIMRVALSLMRRNESKIMASREFEEVMQLLLGRNLWQAYNFDADDLVNDFMTMTGVVSGDILQKLRADFEATHGSESGAWSAFLPDAQAAASRFLGRLWTASPMKAGSLMPGISHHSRPGSSFLRRTPSKQSIVTVNSVDISGSDSTNSIVTVTTDATSVSRDSHGDAISMASKPESMILIPGALTKDEKDLHSQIEDLLTALSDMQRQHAFLSAALQREREERNEDFRAMEELVSHLKPQDLREEEEEETRPRSLRHATKVPQDEEMLEARRQTMQVLSQKSRSPSVVLPVEVAEVVQRLDSRIEMHRSIRRSRASDILETKQRLRDSLIRSKDQVESEVARSAELSRQLDEREQETAAVRDSLRTVQTRLQDEIKKKEELERTIQTLSGGGSTSSSRAGSVVWSDAERPLFLQRSDTLENMRSAPSRQSVSRTGGSGLRELKLASSQLSTPSSSIPKRGSSLATQKILATEDHAPASEEEMLLELVNAKTAEATARQELEEVKGKLDAMRRMLGMPSPGLTSSPPALSTPANPHKSSISESFFFGGNRGADATTPSKPSKQSTMSPPGSGTSGTGASLASGFWGWSKRSLSTSTPGPALAAQASAGTEESPGA